MSSLRRVCVASVASGCAAFSGGVIAAVVSTLTLVIGGIALTADLLGIGGSLLGIFGAGNLDTQSDDHPLYSRGRSSPTLTISATETTFNLLLQQPNDVGEPEDDLPAVLSGITKISTPNGNVDVWKWSITLEAEIPTLGIGCSNFETDLEAQGFVQHVRAPHPGLGEVPQAPALEYDLRVARTATGTILCTWKQGTIAVSDSDQYIHPDGPDLDVLEPATLSARCCSTFNGDIDSFSVRLVAEHGCTPPRRGGLGPQPLDAGRCFAQIPEPSITPLVAIGALGLVGASLRRGRRRHA